MIYWSFFLSVMLNVSYVCFVKLNPDLVRPCFVFRLVEVLRDFTRTDWQLGGMVCQVLWNYSGKITSSNSYFGEQESVDLVEILTEYLGEWKIAYIRSQFLETSEQKFDFVVTCRSARKIQTSLFALKIMLQPWNDRC